MYLLSGMKQFATVETQAIHNALTTPRNPCSPNDRKSKTKVTTAGVKQSARPASRQRKTRRSTRVHAPASWGYLEQCLLQEVAQCTLASDSNNGSEVTRGRLHGKNLVSAAAVNRNWRGALHWTNFPACVAWRSVLGGSFTWRLLATAPYSLLEIQEGRAHIEEPVREDIKDDELAIYDQMDVDVGEMLGAETDNQVVLATLTKICSNIKGLHLNGAVHPWTMVCLSRFRQLRELHLNYVKCPWNGVFHTATAGWSKLRTVDFGRHFLEDDMLDSLGSHCPRLRCVVADRCSAVTDAGVIAMARGCQMLEQIDFSRAHISDASLSAFAEYCPNLRWLELNECHHVSDVGLAAFKGDQSEETQSHDDRRNKQVVQKETLAAATKLNQQRERSRGTVTVHVPCPKLASLSLMHTAVTQAGVDDFKRWVKDQARLDHEIDIEFETADDY